MRRILPLLLTVCLLFISYSPYISADIKDHFGTTVAARVGEFFLDLSGFASPYASVVLTSDGIFLRSTVADEKGNFSISQVLIKAGFSHFCLESVDFKKIGDSNACLTIPPATGSVVKNNIFLPPTIGVSRTSAASGEEILAFGYTMPWARVTLNLGKEGVRTVLADGTGYYVFRLKNLPPGTYNLSATARYKEQDSLSSTKKVQFHSLSVWDNIIQFLKELWSKIIAFFTSIGLGLLWLAIPVLILIIILILKTWPERFAKKEVHHLHHYWEFGE